MEAACPTALFGGSKGQSKRLLNAANPVRAVCSLERGQCRRRRGAWRTQALQQRAQHAPERALGGRCTRHRRTLACSREKVVPRLRLIPRRSAAHGQTCGNRICPAVPHRWICPRKMSQARGPICPFLGKRVRDAPDAMHSDMDAMCARARLRPVQLRTRHEDHGRGSTHSARHSLALQPVVGAWPVACAGIRRTHTPHTSHATGGCRTRLPKQKGWSAWLP